MRIVVVECVIECTLVPPFSFHERRQIIMGCRSCPHDVAFHSFDMSHISVASSISLFIFSSSPRG